MKKECRNCRNSRNIEGLSDGMTVECVKMDNWILAEDCCNKWELLDSE